jgi:hypothetical protein
MARDQHARSRRRLWLAVEVVLVGIILAATAYIAVALVMRAGKRELGLRPNANPVLSGTRPIDRPALARLAVARAGLGARWLAGDQRPDGSFFYKYFPRRNAYDLRDYNPLRHAGTTYSLYQVYDVTRDPRVLAAAERGSEWIDRNSFRSPDGSGRAFVFEGVCKLGGQALALIALLERRRVTGDARYDRLISEMARLLASLKVPGQAGRYYQSYRPASNHRSLLPASDYYPAEALLAVTRLAQRFPGRGYIQDAAAAGHYLLHTREGTWVRSPRQVVENHWLALAFSELYRMRRDSRFRRAAYLQADSMRRHQFTARDGEPEAIGAPTDRMPINYTSSSTKAEALVAVWALARWARDVAAERRFSQAALRNVQFQMRVQFTPALSRRFPRPDRTVWAWPQDPFVDTIRMDFVQHNISALITAWQILRRGDVATAA